MTDPTQEELDRFVEQILKHKPKTPAKPDEPKGDGKGTNPDNGETE